MSVRDELQSLLGAYARAYQAGEASARAKLYTPDGELHSPYAPLARGRSEIEALHKAWTEHVSGEKKLAIVHAGASGDLAWCLATYSEGHVTGNGASLNVLERQADGSWLIRMSSLNSTDQPAAG
jgi:uncharacterized protein (TIGR02246 family)